MDSTPVETHLNQRFDPIVPSISYPSNQRQLSTTVPTAPLESPRDHQPCTESGYIFPDMALKDDPPSYAEAIST